MKSPKNREKSFARKMVPADQSFSIEMSTQA
jgi:hypothetical protein